MATLLVGDKFHPTRSAVHKTLICAYSEVVAGAFRNNWKPPTDTTFEMLDEELEAVEDYVGILYQQEQFVEAANAFDETNEDQDYPNISKSRYTRLCKLYRHCDKYNDEASAKLVITAVVEVINTKYADGAQYFPPRSLVNYIYENTVPRDAIRKLFTDCYVDFADDSWLTLQDIKKWDDDFRCDALLGMVRRRGSPTDLSRTTAADNYL
jgi:hypothetical protein